jgi:glycosyltransferase involved in cell wall biosynthesis
MVKLSIVMPVRNALEYLEMAVESALFALAPTDELVIQDGASTDGTFEYLLAKSEQDPRIKVISEKDSGQSDALSRAITRATGDYIVWMNGDDVLSDVGIEILRSIVSESSQNHPLPFHIFGHQICNQEGEVLRSFPPEELNKMKLLLRGCYVFSGSIVIPKALMPDLGAFDESLHFSMDLDFMFRIESLSLQTVTHNQPLGILRWHDGAKSSSQGFNFLGDSLKVRYRYSTNVWERFVSLGGYCLQALAILSTPIRHSELYSRLRRRSLAPND